MNSEEYKKPAIFLWAPSRGDCEPPIVVQRACASPLCWDCWPAAGLYICGGWVEQPCCVAAREMGGRKFWNRCAKALKCSTWSGWHSVAVWLIADRKQVGASV